VITIATSRADVLRKEEEARKIKRPKTVYKVSGNKLTKAMVFADCHFPFQDNDVLTLLYRFMEDLKPDIVVLGGDILDFPQISRFRNLPSSSETILKDLQLVYNMFKRIREILPNAKIFFVEGNHEFRWRSYLLDNAPLFYELFSLSLPELLNLEKLKVDYIPCPPELTKFSHNYVEIGGFYIGHFDKALKNACYTGRMLRDEFGVNIVQFHGHKVGSAYRTYLEGVRVGIEVGCTCRLNPSFRRIPDWQHGFGVLYLRGKKNNFYNVVIKNHSFIFNGKTYAISKRRRR
jgi:hypothetical protein